jgi:hypothetical protein
MPAPPPYLLWLDPGGMTGFARLVNGSFAADEFGWDAACRELEAACEGLGSLLHIGYERFTILPSTHKLHPEPEAYEFPGVIKHLARKYKCVLLQPAMPSERLAATPAELKALQWWTPGKNDAQSASQHLLAWLKREHCLPPHVTTLLAQVH